MATEKGIVNQKKIYGFYFSIWFFYLPLLSGKARLQVYASCILLGMGASMLAIDSLAMISEMIDRNTVGD